MKYFSKALLLFTFVLFFSSCNQDEQIENTEVNQSLESVLSEMSKIAKSENKIVKFTLLINKDTDKYGVENVRLLENSQEVIDFTNGVNQAISNRTGGAYQVDCTDSAGNTTSTTCADYMCVGYQVAICVENGGCATVCKAELSIMP